MHTDNRHPKARFQSSYDDEHAEIAAGYNTQQLVSRDVVVSYRLAKLRDIISVSF